MSQHLYFNIGQESRPVIEKLTKQNVKESRKRPKTDLVI